MKKRFRSDESPEPAENFKSLFGVDQIPSDSRLRERLDDVDPRRLRPTFKNIFTGLQRGKVLEKWTVLDDYYLIAIDGTGTRSSHKIKCEKCCVKEHRNGSKTQRLPLTFELASLATTLGVRHGLVILDAQQYHSGGCLVGGTSVKGGIVFERVLICYGPVGNISASSGLFILLDMAR